MRASRLIATLGGIGLLRPAPGTWASAAVLPAAWVLHGLGGFTLLAAATVLAAAIGWWAVSVEERLSNTHDDSEIVIDELVGIWLALWPLSLGLSHAGAPPWLFPWPGWVGAFLLFRGLDIWKPGPIGWADRRPGAWGVMLDDIIAGLFTAVGVAFAAFVAHGILGV